MSIMFSHATCKQNFAPGVEKRGFLAIVSPTLVGIFGKSLHLTAEMELESVQCVIDNRLGENRPYSQWCHVFKN